MNYVSNICVLLVRLMLSSNLLNSVSQNSNFKRDSLEKSLFKVSKRVTSLRVKVSNRKYECRMLLINDRYLCIVLLPLIFDFDFCCPWYLLNVMSKVPTSASSVTSVLAIKKAHHVAAILKPHQCRTAQAILFWRPYQSDTNRKPHQIHVNRRTL